jgi:hypothetical protein
LTTLDEVTTLRDFVRDNDKLLTMFGVFSGLSAVLFQVHHPYLALASTAMALLLLFETLSYAPLGKKRLSLSYQLFIFGLMAIGLGLAAHLALESFKATLANIVTLSVVGVFVVIYVGGRILTDRFTKARPVKSGPIRATAEILLIALILTLIYLFSSYFVHLFLK